MGRKSKKAKRIRIYQTKQNPRAIHPPPEFYPLPYPFAREEMQLLIGPDCKAHIVLHGAVTQEAIRKLIAHLEITIESFPEKIKDSATQD